jgi:glycerol-3-phosphate dehydrogenase
VQFRGVETRHDDMIEQADVVDVLVVGGGINGAGIARDAVGRGLSVLLVERSDLAAATSSASSKLIHGGLRYLEHYAFRLVRESLAEREVLWGAAPHLIWPLRFVLPVHRGLRPPWLLRLGLYLYDHIGGRERLPPTRSLRREADSALAPLAEHYRRGFEYSDCCVDDARLVVATAVDAAERGARVKVGCELKHARREKELWCVTLRSADGVESIVRARALVNATGPWVEDVAQLIGVASMGAVRLLKGSHIVTRRIHDGDRAYTLQGGDGRIVFVIPYQENLTLIGTTEVPTSEPASPKASDEEIRYLLATASNYLRSAVGIDDVVWSYSGVRALYEDGSAKDSRVTRDYTLEIDAPSGKAPVLTVFGGKVTTYRRMAEEALQLLQPSLGFCAPPWTRSAPLPGGNLGNLSFEDFAARKTEAYTFLNARLVRRLCRAYGTRIDEVLNRATSLDEIGVEIAPSLYEAELRYMREKEWARTGEDALWRRSKLGLSLDASERARVSDWFVNASPLDAAPHATQPDPGRVSLPRG